VRGAASDGCPYRDRQLCIPGVIDRILPLGEWERRNQAVASIRKTLKESPANPELANRYSLALAGGRARGEADFLLVGERDTRVKQRLVENGLGRTAHQKTAVNIAMNLNLQTFEANHKIHLLAVSRDMDSMPRVETHRRVTVVLCNTFFER
jgi:hypothetical protein